MHDLCPFIGASMNEGLSEMQYVKALRVLKNMTRIGEGQFICVINPQPRDHESAERRP
jgi:hypothetical protein